MQFLLKSTLPDYCRGAKVSAKRASCAEFPVPAFIKRYLFFIHKGKIPSFQFFEKPAGTGTIFAALGLASACPCAAGRRVLATGIFAKIVTEEIAARASGLAETFFTSTPLVFLFFI